MPVCRRPGAPKISSAKLWDNAIAVNLTAPMLLSQRVARRLIETKKPGRIINMVSIYAGVASSVYRLSAYCATKAGLANLTRQLAVEWAPHNILVNAIAPGWIPTEATEGGIAKAGNKERMETVYAAGPTRPAGGIARRGDFPRESGLELRHRNRAFRRWWLSILVNRRFAKVSRGAGAGMDDRSKLRRQLFRRKPAATLRSDAETHAADSSARSARST